MFDTLIFIFVVSKLSDFILEYHTHTGQLFFLLAIRTFIIPLSLLSLLFSVCGGVISGSNHGIINSPGYPGDYPNERDCVWRISVNPGNNIVLAFADLDIETHPNCSFDHLRV